MADPVTVAIPVRNGGGLLAEVLESLDAQRLDRPMQVLVADSGSTDGSRELARRHGAEVIDVPTGEFSHGGTRNLLARRATGSHVAFITQDAVPAHDGWLAGLLAGFDVADDVALVFGPYRARAGASLYVRREYDGWFGSLSPQAERGVPPPGAPDGFRRLFFTDANGCVERAAWERVPFREVAYAEDQLLARDMLAAGYAKVYRPDAAVIHSHAYHPLDQFRRSFDEWRGLREVNAIAFPIGLVDAALAFQRSVREDVALALREGQTSAGLIGTAGASLLHHAGRTLGAALGSRAERLPARVRGVCSLEGRAGYQPIGEPS